MIRIKRVYEPPEAGDGMRVLVDRLWPRGLKREVARVDLWAKEVAPSHELRKWFGHETARWKEFQIRYRRELQSPEAEAILAELSHLARKETVTLIFAASDIARNNAVTLREILDSRLGMAAGRTGPKKS